MPTRLLPVLGLALVACSGSGEGSGEDQLPKRGELATDPTIVSATAYCITDEVVLPGDPPAEPQLFVQVSASDPAGNANLGQCAGDSEAGSDQSSFSAGACCLWLAEACTTGTAHVVDLTAANQSGGITTASVTLTVSPGSAGCGGN